MRALGGPPRPSGEGEGPGPGPGAARHHLTRARHQRLPQTSKGFVSIPPPSPKSNRRLTFKSPPGKEGP